MSGIKVDWKGMDKALTTLANAPERTKWLTSAVIKNNGELFKKKAKEKAPRDTWMLHDEIYSEYWKEGDTQHAKIVSPMSYSPYQEFGTRYFPEGNPFFAPTMKEIIPKVREELDDVMKGAFK